MEFHYHAFCAPEQCLLRQGAPWVEPVMFCQPPDERADMSCNLLWSDLLDKLADGLARPRRAIPLLCRCNDASYKSLWIMVGSVVLLHNLPEPPDHPFSRKDLSENYFSIVPDGLCPSKSMGKKDFLTRRIVQKLLFRSSRLSLPFKICGKDGLSKDLLTTNVSNVSKPFICGVCFFMSSTVFG